MNELRAAAAGATLLRVSMGVLFLSHVTYRIYVITPAGAASFFRSLSLPGALAYVVTLAEARGGVALILGVWTRIVALALVPILLGAILVVHGANGFLFTNPNGGWEYPAFWTVALIVQALLGPGLLALRPTPSH